MASLTFTTADAVLKDDYKQPLREQLNQATFILTQVEQNTDDVVGRHAYLALHTSRSSAIGARGETGTIPTAASQGYKKALVPLRQNEGRIQISVAIIRAMSKDRGAFTQAVKSETDGIARDLKQDMNRQVMGTSNGVIAQLGTTTASTTVVLATTTTTTQMRQLFFDGGMVADIGTVASPTTIASARTITSVDFSAKTFVISGAAVTTSASHFVFRSGNGGASDNTGNPGGADGQFELTGLQTIVDSTTAVFTLDPATTPSWAATEDATGGTPTENLVNKNIQNAEILSDKQVDLMVTDASVHRALAAQQTAMRRNNDTVALKAGYTGLAWEVAGEGNPTSKRRTLMWHRDNPEGQLFGLCTDELVEFVGLDWDWMDDDGAVLSRVPDKTAFEATFMKINELATSRRNAMFKLTGLVGI